MDSKAYAKFAVRYIFQLSVLEYIQDIQSAAGNLQSVAVSVPN